MYSARVGRKTVKYSPVDARRMSPSSCPTMALGSIKPPRISIGFALRNRRRYWRPLRSLRMTKSPSANGLSDFFILIHTASDKLEKVNSVAFTAGIRELPTRTGGESTSTLFSTTMGLSLKRKFLIGYLRRPFSM